MKFLKRLACITLAALCLWKFPIQAHAQEDVSPYIQRLIQYYLHYQSDAQEEMETLLAYITECDPGQGLLWQQIMDDWAFCNETQTITYSVLPDGLPQDDSLCIVVLGYGLNADGSMKEELVDRLVVALASALKYPNAYVCVTGGATASASGNTEAGQMAAWLQSKGLDSSRLILETKSLSTHTNATRVYKILNKQYPQVTSVAVVSSDYHIAWGTAMFATALHYGSYNGGREITLVGNAANVTGKTMDTLYSQAMGISAIVGLTFDGTAIPARYAVEETTMEVLPLAEPVAVEPEEDRSWMIFPTAMLAVAGVLVLIPAKKKETAEK